MLFTEYKTITHIKSTFSLTYFQNANIYKKNQTHHILTQLFSIIHIFGGVIMTLPASIYIKMDFVKPRNHLK